VTAGLEYTWRDSELRSPPLRAINAIGAGLNRLGLDRPALSCESVIEAAVKAASCDDFGSDSYHEPLDVFVTACRSEAELTTFGRFLVSRMLQRALANRLALQRWATEHPQVRAEAIAGPWVIVGLPRTGTSILSMLLGLDPRSRPLLQWEAAHPVPPTTLAEASADPRIRRTDKELAGLLKLNPPLRAMHPFGATLAEECVTLFMYDLRTLALETQAHVPSYARWLEQADMTPAYEQHRLALQTLQSRRPTERWILKTPNHLWHLDALLAAYPDARIIWTHRDPGPVITSLASLANAAQLPQTSRRDPLPTATEWRRKCEFALRSAMAYDDKAPNGWCRHLYYDNLLADPVAAVRELYLSFGDEVSNEHAERMTALLADRPQDAFGRHRYDPADFGWTYAEISEQFSYYTSRYDVRPESAAGPAVPA
jgi:Sulfotransferase family